MTWRSAVRLAAALAIGAVVAWSGCAKRGMPPGGPEDKTAPVVATMSPASESVGVDLASEIRLVFSEPMKRRTVETAVIVSPPTRWAKRYWQDAAYVLVPASPLLPQTTYLVSVGASAMDRHGVKLGKTFVAGFSTGETIEAGVISGKVAWKGMSVEQAVVEVFEADVIGEITGVPTADPAYVSLSGVGGTFEIPFVNPRVDYDLIAFIDKDGNGDRDKGEIIGCAGGTFSFADSLRLPGVEILLCADELKGSLKGLVVAPAGLGASQPADSTAGAAPDGPTAPPAAPAPIKLAVVAQALDDSVAYRVATDQEGRFTMTCINPGRYRLEAFVDYNGNQRRDPADSFFVELADTVDIAPCTTAPYVEIKLEGGK